MRHACATRSYVVHLKFKRNWAFYLLDLRVQPWPYLLVLSENMRDWGSEAIGLTSSAASMSKGPIFSP